jgi:peptidoglycan-associated lipoprotein
VPLDIQHRFRAPVLAALSALILAGCASSVPLETTPAQAPAPTSTASSSATGAGVPGTGASREGISGQASGADPAASAAAQAAASAAAAAPGDSAALAAAKAAIARIEPSVYFDFDSFVVKPDYQNTVSTFASFLRADPRAELIIEGNADERGTSEYNLALGQKRAEAVARALGVLGVAESRVEAVSNGEEKPRATGSTESAWAQNRRADLLVK